MNRKVFSFLTVIALYGVIIVTMGACATIMSGTKQNVSFNTDPQGAKVLVNGQDKGVTPVTVKVPRKKQAVYTFEHAGYVDGIITEKGRLNSWFLGNVFVIGFIVDGATGAMWKFDESVFYKFASSQSNIVRWRFDSDPRGARISWRILSSIPDVVQNTNETYLATTPYEETRAFDILGLTYENSTNVSVEIKVERSGYYEQVKRYNLRQAFDQREISGFFELVPTN